MDAIPNELLLEATRIRELSRELLLLRVKLLLPLPAAEKRGILGQEDWVRVPGLDVEIETLDQDCFLQSGIQVADGHLFLQIAELHRPCFVF